MHVAFFHHKVWLIFNDTLVQMLVYDPFGPLSRCQASSDSCEPPRLASLPAETEREREKVIRFCFFAPSGLFIPLRRLVGTEMFLFRLPAEQGGGFLQERRVSRHVGIITEL